METLKLTTDYADNTDMEDDSRRSRRCDDFICAIRVIRGFPFFIRVCSPATPKLAKAGLYSWLILFLVGRRFWQNWRSQQALLFFFVWMERLARRSSIS